MPAGLLISDFYYDSGVALRATVTWDPANPGSAAQADMVGDHPGGGTWEEHNGGVAFLHLFRAGSSLRFETWGTDTNGDYTAAAIDIFTLPIDLTGPFPQNANLQAPSLHIPTWVYVLSPVAGNPSAFRLTAGNKPTPTPPSNARINVG